MTVASSLAKAGPYEADGEQKEFPFGFAILDPTHVAVWLDGIRVTSGFYVVPADVGGTVVFNEPPVGKVMILRDVPFTQMTDIQNGTAFYPSLIERMGDQLTMICQQLKEEISRCARAIPGDDAADLGTYLSTLKDTAVGASQVAVEAAALARQIASEINVETSSASLTAHNHAADAHSELFGKCLSVNGGAIYGEINSGTDSARIVLTGGSNYTKGAYLTLNGMSYAAAPGVVYMVANNGIKSCALYLNPSGEMVWDSKNVVRSVNGRNANGGGDVTLNTFSGDVTFPEANGIIDPSSQVLVVGVQVKGADETLKRGPRIAFYNDTAGNSLTGAVTIAAEDASNVTYLDLFPYGKAVLRGRDLPQIPDYPEVVSENLDSLYERYDLEPEATKSENGTYTVPYDGWLYIEVINNGQYHVRARVNGCRVMTGAGNGSQASSAFIPVRKGDSVVVTSYDWPNDKECTQAKALAIGGRAFGGCTFIMYAYPWSTPK